MKIDIDREVFNFLQERAEPFIDTPNTVLRRELGIDKGIIVKKEVSHEIQNNIPAGLDQILKVIFLIKVKGLSRNHATRTVARENSIYPQTVIDKYCRQLTLDTRQFDILMNETGLTELKNILLNKFSNYKSVIDDYFVNKIFINKTNISNTRNAIEEFTKEINAKKTSNTNRIFNRDNYYELDEKFLIIKISRSRRPFWGLSKKIIDYLTNDYLKGNFYLILLQSNNEGWIFNNNDIYEYIEKGKWNLASDNNYKINYNTISGSSQHFKSTSEFHELVKRIS